MKTMIPFQQRLPLAVISFLSVIILTVPFPGSLSVVLTRSLASAAGTPGVDLLSEGMLIVLAFAAVAVGVYTWRFRSGRRLTVMAGSVGVVLAYAVSETTKLLFAQPRPCHLWAVPGECPALGDWSLPSNHATLAFGALLVIALATRRALITWLALGPAVLVAVGRVMEGAHYLHDVALGAMVGLAVPAVAVFLAIAWQQRKPTSLAG